MSPVWVILKREWKGYFNSPIAYVFVCVHLFLSSFWTFNIGKLLEAGQSTMAPFFDSQPWLLLMLVPAISMRMWSEERRTGTLELLLSAPITTAQAVLGKFLAAWMLLLFTLALTLPIAITVTVLGSPDFGAIAAGYLGCCLLAGAYLAVGSWASALARSQVVSFIMACAVGLFMMLAGSPAVTDALQAIAPLWLVEVIVGFSFGHHMQQLERGLIDLRDVLYFVCVIFYMLLATRVTLDNRISK